MKTSESIVKLIAALAKAQAEMKPAVMDAKNSHFGNKYATFASIINACRDPLSKNGLAFVQILSTEDSSWYIETTLFHESGEWISSGKLKLILKDQTMQALGSAITYAKRYSLCAMLGIVADEDDDGQAASQEKTDQVQKVVQQKTQGKGVL